MDDLPDERSNLVDVDGDGMASVRFASCDTLELCMAALTVLVGAATVAKISERTSMARTARTLSRTLGRA